MPLAQGVDRRIGDLAEILAEKVADRARLVRDDRERRVVAHRTDGFLGVLDHRRQDQLYILQRQVGRDLPLGKFGPVPGRARIRLGGRQVGRIAEAPDKRSVVPLRGDPVLDRAVVIDPPLGKVDGDHLARPQSPLGDHGRFRHDNHARFRPDDQQIVGRAGKAQRAQRVTIHARDRPAPVRHGERRRTVPRLHDGGEIVIHGGMFGRRVAVLLPRLRHQHELGRRRVAPGAAQRLEHRVERGGVGCACRNHRLDVLAILAEGERGHLDLVALHPVLVAADRVDLAIVGEGTEWLGQPPLREGVGRIPLVKDRDAAFEPLVGEIGVEDRQRFREEQPLVDDRAARQRADVEIVDLRGDHLLLDAAADEVEVALERGEVLLLRHGAGDHDLLDLGPGALRLLADNGDVHRHLAPAIDGVARLDDLALDDGAAGFLRGEVGARQEHHADREAVGLGAMAGRGDGVVEEAQGQVDMDARAVAGLAIRIDCAAMPHGLQRVDGALDDPAARLAVGRRDEPDAAGIGFEFRAIHALGGEAEAFGFHRVGHGFIFQKSRAERRERLTPPPPARAQPWPSPSDNAACAR